MPIVPLILLGGGALFGGLLTDKVADVVDPQIAGQNNPMLYLAAGVGIGLLLDEVLS